MFYTISMKILILGGRGNLGCQLTKAFSADHETISLDRDDFDVLDAFLLKESFLNVKPDLVLNAVAYNAVDKCEDADSFELAKKLNSWLPGKLAELCLENSVALVHYSSDYVFSGTEDKPDFFENETPNPCNKYGESKFWGEEEIKRRANSGLEYYLIRTSKLFGPRGDSPEAKASFFDLIKDRAIKNLPLDVVNEELSCFTYTPDLAQATKRLWELEVPFGAYHLVNEGPLNWFQAAEIFFEKSRMADVKIRPVRSEDLRRPARRPKFSVLRNHKSKKLRSWNSALEEYIREDKVGNQKI